MSLGTATPYIACYVLIEKDGKIAFVLRENTAWMNNHYGLPSGKVENDESYLAAAVREAKEEVGINVEPADLKFVHVMHRREGYDWVDVYFKADSWKGEPYNAEPHMHSELAWFALNDLPENTIPPVKFALEQIEAGRQYSEYGWAI